MGKVILETERLILRKPVPEDAEAIMAIRNSDYVLEYNPMETVTLEKMKKVLEEEAGDDIAMYIELKDEGKIIGNLDLCKDNLRYMVESRMLGYYLDEKYGGKGYMTEAIKAAVEYAFKELKVEVVSARVFKGNEKSARLLEKLGFTHEGTIRRGVRGREGRVFDDMIFSMLAEEYAGQQG